MLKNRVGEMFFAEPAAFSFINFPPVDSPWYRGGMLLRDKRLEPSNEALTTCPLAFREVGEPGIEGD